jgi:hypothetical protein
VFSILSMITLTAFTSGLAGVPFVGVPMAHAIDNRGTEAQQLACTPDVFRFCGSQIPDVDRIVVCLRQNMTSLSNGCRAVFDAEASMQTENKPAAVAAKPQQRTASPKPAARAPQPAPMPPPPNPSVDDNDD